MSKLYTKYTKLKEKNPDTVYLFKAGIFYLALGEDAIRLSVSLKLNLGKLNEEIEKVGFPVSLEALQIPFQFVDDTYGVIENYSDYSNNEKLKSMISKILSLDFDNLTFKEAFEFLMSTQKELSVIYPKEENKTN